MTAEIMAADTSTQELCAHIQDLLLAGRGQDALTILQEQVAPLCGPGRPLPGRMATISAQEVTVAGWEHLPSRLIYQERAHSPVTAISIDLADPAIHGQVPDEQGGLDPLIETTYYTDSAWPFSKSDAAMLAKACRTNGCDWHNSAEDVDETIAIVGLASLNGAVAILGERLSAAQADVSAADLAVLRRAHTLGACIVAVLVHLAVQEQALKTCPRALAIFVGHNDAFPGLRAPVASSFNHLAEQTVSLLPEPPEQDTESLPILETDLAEIPEELAWHLPATGTHISGTQLRKRLITPESLAGNPEPERKSLLQRLFGRNSA